MIRRNTWIVLAVFLASLVGVFIWQQARENEAPVEPTPNIQSVYLMQVDESTITELRFENQAGDVVVIGRDEQGLWTLIEPPAEETDLAKAESSISQLVAISSVAVVEPAPPPTATGLALPAYTITVKTASSPARVLKVGNVTPTGSGYYVQVNDEPVYVVGTFSIDAIMSVLIDPPMVVTPTPELTFTPVLTGTVEITGTVTPEP